tara:strand:+ start:13354 stop:13629 length:276 start_codon:yes stop_codon:yes gene_type:complete
MRRLTLISGFSVIICTVGSSERAKAVTTAIVASAVVEAKVVIHRRVELLQDGSIDSDVLDGPGLMQVNIKECDTEARRMKKNCVFLIYEIQ